MNMRPSKALVRWQAGNTMKSIAESQSIMNSFISNDKVFAICLKENNKVIGTVGIEKYGLEDAFNRIQGLLRQRIRLCFE